MMVHDFLPMLAEAGVVTADLSRQATRAVQETLGSLAQQVVEQQSIAGDTDRSALYDHLFRKVMDDPAHRAQTAEWIGRSLSQALTELTRRYVAERFPKLNHLPLSGRFTPGKIKVRLLRQPSDDPRGGHFSPWELESVIHFDPDLAAYALMNKVAEQVLGEAMDDEYRRFTQAVVSVYLHEHTHLEQALRSKTGDIHDQSYVTAGIKGRARKGKRGGWHRDTSTQDGYLRYKGSRHEIDAFSSEAAFEIASAVRESDWDYNGALNHVRQSLAYGYASDSPTAQHYRDLVWHAFEGAYQDFDLDPAQMRRAWQRFAKQVYLKVGAYLRPTYGKADTFDSTRMNPTWVWIARKHPRAATVAMLARLVADDMAIDVAADADPDRKLDQLVERIPRGYGSEDQSDAETFLRTYYHGSTYDSEIDAATTLKVFRGLALKFLHERLRTVRR